jgi:predicted glutamine amidotransferase
MCELLGFSSAVPTDISEHLSIFFSHSVKHPHGWDLCVKTVAERCSESL